MLLLTFVATLGLVVIHLFAYRLRFLDQIPRSIWLSGAGGISVAYVFLHLLPELAEGQEAMRAQLPAALQPLAHHAYLVAFIGLALFYGLERAAKGSRDEARRDNARDVPSSGVFWLHLASFSVYNLLIGYLLVSTDRTARDLAFFAVAMGLHFLVTDFGLREHYKHDYVRIGRWVLSGAVILGWAAGWAAELPDLAVHALVAFLAGGVILNVLKEELPEERKSRFSAFLFGGAAYAALLVTL